MNSIEFRRVFFDIEISSSCCNDGKKNNIAHELKLSHPQVLCFAAFIATAVAQFGYEHGHGHGLAFSSNHISKHDGHPEVVHGHGHHVDYHVRITYLIIAIINIE